MIRRGCGPTLLVIALGLLTIVRLAAEPTVRAGEPPVANDEARSPQLSIQLSDDGSQIKVAGFSTRQFELLRGANIDDQAWADVFCVMVASDRDSKAVSTAAVMGRYKRSDGGVTFTPRFPLRPGLTYRVNFDLGSIEEDALAAIPAIEATVGLPRRTATVPAKVEAVYPSGDELPANLLKFYIHFSAPMSRGDAYRHVCIVDAEGRAVHDAFLELPEELWDATGRRLTILFDPGRIKRGLKPNEDVGAPLVSDQNYALVVLPGWRDANGESVATEFRKEFRVAEADIQQPDPTAWRVTPPVEATREPLTVVVNEPLDHALLERSLEVIDRDEHIVEGEVTISDEETRWQFRPTASWRPGDYRIVVDPTLEDRAGNSLGRAFETHDPTAPVGAAVEEPVVIPFAVTP